MTLFVDASALVAIIANELERDAFTAELVADPILLWSPTTCWESVVALSKSDPFTIADVRANVEDTAAYFGFSLVSIGDAELRCALDAYERFGKGRHRASLNFGDCFAYACAKANDARLLYKGDDFSHTDLA